MVLLELWRVAMNYKTVVVVVVFSVSIALELIPPSSKGGTLMDLEIAGRYPDGPAADLGPET